MQLHTPIRVSMLAAATLGCGASSGRRNAMRPNEIRREHRGGVAPAAGIAALVALGAMAPAAAGQACAPGEIFQDAVGYGAGAEPHEVALGDLDADGDADMVVANASSGDASVLLNRGDGTFEAEVRYGVGIEPQGVALGDVDADGDADMVTTSFGAGGDGNGVSVLLNHGDGTFAPAVQHVVLPFLWAPNSVTMEDLDGDGDADVIITYAIVNVGGAGGAVVLLSQGDGTYGDPSYYNPDNVGVSTALGDLDGDGDPDMVAVTVSLFGVSEASVLLNNGDGTFGEPISYDVDGSGGDSAALGDLDGDGDADAVVVNSYSDDVRVLLTRIFHRSLRGRVDPATVTGPRRGWVGAGRSARSAPFPP